MKFARRGDADIGCVGIIVVFLIVALICGGVGSLCWPYTINTWADHFLGPDDSSKDISAGTGFLLGICPVVGQLTFPALIITAVCDWIFIEDYPDK